MRTRHKLNSACKCTLGGRGPRCHLERLCRTVGRAPASCEGRHCTPYIACPSHPGQSYSAYSPTPFLCDASRTQAAGR